jgi:hypothetical protein
MYGKCAKPYDYLVIRYVFAHSTDFMSFEDVYDACFSERPLWG